MGFELAELVTSRRKELGLSRQELSRASEVSYPYLSQIETGDREPSIKTMAKLAQALDLPITDLAAASPQSWAGVDREALSSLSGPASSRRGSAPSADPARDKLLLSLRRRLADVPPLVRVELLAELMHEAAREAGNAR